MGPPTAAAQEKQRKMQPHLQSILAEMQQAQQGTATRQGLIKEIEALDTIKPRRLLVYIGNVANPNSSINMTHIVPLADALTGIGRTENLDLMIHTLGGSGDTAEKVVEMCRNHCSGEFRVIIPNMAKSAGTLIALGADTIVMGHCSEVGPTDPQIRITVGNAPQMISAWTFIHARDELAAKVNEANARGENADAYLQQLATIDSVFVKHCEQLMEFAKKVGRKWIAARLTATSVPKAEAEKRADEVIDFLSDVQEHIIHGRLILAKELKTNCEPTLHILELEETSSLWQKLWNLYVRYEVFLMSPNPTGVPHKAVIIETASTSLTING
jgi:ATP-dependent protease ClpP protease subunit